jgi:prevent-host-death family protein
LPDRLNFSRSPHKAEPLPTAPDGAREVSVRELDRRASKVIAAVVAGEVAIVTRYGVAVAAILPAADAVRLLPPAYVMGGGLEEISRRLADRERARQRSELMHGRWY